MDTTPKYIKMCEQAEEIQKRWGPSEADVYIYKGQRKFVKLTAGFVLVHQENPKALIWLPSQSRLQNIAFPLCVEQGICGLPAQSYQFIHCLHEFMLDHSEISGASRGKGRCEWLPSNETTLEQWWLMLIMEKKYDKHWDNEKEKWVK